MTKDNFTLTELKQNIYRFCIDNQLVHPNPTDKHIIEIIEEWTNEKYKIIPDTSRGSCPECGEGYDNDAEWKYNTHCELCGHPIPEHLIIKK